MIEKMSNVTALTVICLVSGLSNDDSVPEMSIGVNGMLFDLMGMKDGEKNEAIDELLNHFDNGIRKAKEARAILEGMKNE